MKFLFTCLIAMPLLCYGQEVFWSENFGTGCNQGLLATAYSSPNGNWTVTNTGTNAGSANVWYVSATENGNNAGECGTGCGSDRSLHLGSISVLGIPADPGAAYYEGVGFCSIFPCGATNKRVESPTINCAGKSDITLSFVYIEGGNTIDNATVWYFDGALWSQLADPAKTFSGVCSPQGIWTNFSIALPASANNNANVRIGFRWINNDDGNATDPSFAVDDIALSVPVNEDNIPPVIICPDNISVLADGNCQHLLANYTGLALVSDNLDPSPALSQVPPPGTIIMGQSVVVLSAVDASGNESSCSFVVSVVDATPPEIQCPANIEVQAELGASGAFVNVPMPVYSDNCGVYELYNNFTGSALASANYPEGITTVIYTASDAAGNATTCQFDVTVNVPPCCPEDLNCDGVINVTDLLIFMSGFGALGSGDPADFNADGVVNVTDLLIFMAVFGSFCP